MVRFTAGIRPPNLHASSLSAPGAPLPSPKFLPRLPNGLPPGVQGAGLGEAQFGSDATYSVINPSQFGPPQGSNVSKPPMEPLALGPAIGPPHDDENHSSAHDR